MIAIIPDVHGRQFWKDVIPRKDEFEKIIFLGDYLDPYGFEGISNLNALDNFKEILEFTKNNLHKHISVIASGDPSIYGIGKYLSSNIEHENLNIVSGISSLQYIFSKIFVDMNDVYITSSHGKIPDFDYILSHKKVCMVTDSKIGPHEICREIQKRNLKKIVVVGENLSYANERITMGKAEDILAIEKFDMNVVVILDEK